MSICKEQIQSGTLQARGEVAGSQFCQSFDKNDFYVKKIYFIYQQWKMLLKIIQIKATIILLDYIF